MHVYHLLLFFIVIGTVAGASLESVELIDPQDKLIGTRDYIRVKATIHKENEPVTLTWYINDKWNMGCDAVCVDNYIATPGFDGFYWAGYAGFDEFHIGQNTLRVVLAEVKTGKREEKVLLFEVKEEELPLIDLELINVTIENYKDAIVSKINATVINHGPDILAEDSIVINLHVNSTTNKSMHPFFSSIWINLQTAHCPGSVPYDCIMDVGDSNTVVIDKESLHNFNQLPPGTYSVRAYLDDINGLRNYREFNLTNNEIYLSFTLRNVEKVYINVTDKQKMPSDNATTFHFCSGCLSDNYCYPTGYLKDNTYCTYTGTFAQVQIIKPSRWQRIIIWFKNLF